jgi:hypothetical protein
MTPHFIAKLSVAGLACFGLATSAFAGSDGSGTPGSLLVFPSFDNTRGDLTLVTVVNTNADQVNGSVNVEFIYINGYNCLEFNRTRSLTPNDEISVLTKNDNPNMEKGYLYVFAKHKITGVPIKFDHLIGQALVLQGGSDEVDYQLAPWVFKAGEALAEGASTELNGNGHRDLDGLEYEECPDSLLVPNFMGHDGPMDPDLELILINLTGGAQFEAVVDFLVYNDNEEVFSAQFSFDCWKRKAIDEISSVFENEFLLSTNHAAGEVPGTTTANFPETGWFRIDGNTAFSTAVQFSDPAILGAVVESLDDEDGGAMLPFTLGEQANGSLLSTNLFGT